MAETTYDRYGGANAPTMTALTRQRAVTERLLLAALDAHDVSAEARIACDRAAFLASASRDLSMSLDGAATREVLRRRTLMREGSWCIVDIVDSDGAVHRLPVLHPDTSQQEMAQNFADRWFPLQAGFIADARPTLVVDADRKQGLAALRELGFGGLLVVPLVVRTVELGAITFIVRADDPPFSQQEIALASDLADLCGFALENERLYRQAHELRELADSANRAKSTFLGTMSHELMTPLNAIGGYVTLLEMGLRGPVNSEQRDDLERIRQNQVHLLTLISEMLTFARSDHGRLEYQCAEASAEAAAREVVHMLHGVAEERRQILVPPVAGIDTLMWADVERVRQILLNLVMNAVKYATAAVGEISVTVTSTRELVFIHVSDNGPGIPLEKLQAIFDPFVQLPSGLASRRGGVGLGLAISRDLARGMHGDLLVTSTLGVGSRFTLQLPRAKPTDASAPVVLAAGRDG
jgi:signal transduction histidine kinase